MTSITNFIVNPNLPYPVNNDFDLKTNGKITGESLDGNYANITKSIGISTAATDRNAVRWTGTVSADAQNMHGLDLRGTYELKSGTANIYGAYIKMNEDALAGATVNIAYGMLIDSFQNLSIGTVNNAVGLFIADPGVGSATNRWTLQTDGKVGMTNLTIGSNTALFVNNATGEITRQTSSARYKENITNLPDADSKKIFDLRPVKFDYKPEFGGSHDEYGLIAEECEAVIPELVARDADGLADGVKYSHLNIMMLRELQRLRFEFDEYKARHPL